MQDTVRTTTYQGYERIVRLYIKPTLGRIKLKNLTPAHLRGLYPLSPGQVRNLLKAARGERLEALYTLAVTTGMRQGELLGLKWEDVNLEAGTIHIRRTLSTATGKGFGFSAPKTAKSRRSIKLPESALSTMKRHHESQLEERNKTTGLWKEHDLVFPTRVGTPMSCQDLITRSFKPLLRKVGVPNIRFHDLRHTCATLLLGKGMHPKLVQELLGHATMAITLDTYSHMLPGMGNQTANAMEDALA